jgi:hypothetical protein
MWFAHPRAQEPPAAPTMLNVVTWNVLYHLHQAEKIFTKYGCLLISKCNSTSRVCFSDRIPHILRELEATNADIIGLQEVT